MTTDEIDLVDQILGPAAIPPGEQSVSAESAVSEPASLASALASEPLSAESTESEPVSPVTDSTPATPPLAPDFLWSGSDSPAGVAASVAPKHRFRLRNPFARARSHAPRRFGPAWFVATLAVSTLSFLLLFAVVALGLSAYYSTRVIPGVHVGSVDVSGLSRDEVIAKLQTSYAYLGQGEVTVTTPVGAATITYQEVGRGPDLEVMADAAMSVGHTDHPIGDAASIIRTAISGRSVPVVVQLDPRVLATRIRPLVGTSVLPPENAQVTLKSGKFAVSPSTGGSGIDEMAISSSIVDKLTEPDAPADLQAGGTFVKLDPQVSDRNAQDAVAAAQKMTVDVTLAWNGAPPAPSPAPSGSAAPSESATSTPTPTPTPTPAPTPTAGKPQDPLKTFTIDASTIRGWIVFGTKPDGSYGPTIDPVLVQSYLWQLSPKVAIPPVEPPKVKFDPSTGAPVSIEAGKRRHRRGCDFAGHRGLSG
jgi:hypothetical protein